MGWRRDEVWLDTDVLWFREQPPKPFAGLALAMPAFATRARTHLFMPSRRGSRPHGSGGSVAGGASAPARHPHGACGGARPRVGHDAPDRRVRQGGGGRDAGPLQADPPSLTLRLDGTRLEVPGRRSRAKRASSASTPAARNPRERLSSARVEWDRATSVGLPYSGRLVDGTQLPVEGADWVTWNPVTDSTPNLPSRLYGHERTIRTILSVIRGVPHRTCGRAARRRRRHQLARRREHGPARLPSERARRGRVLPAARPAPERSEGDRPDRPRPLAGSPRPLRRRGGTGRLRRLLDRAPGPSGVVVPYPNHEDHMHVRFPASRLTGRPPDRDTGALGNPPLDRRGPARYERPAALLHDHVMPHVP